MDKQELYTTAELANIELKENELETLGQAVDQMVSFFEKMNEIDVSTLEPTTHAFVKANRLRPDVAVPSILAEAILEQAPEIEDRFICIPNVL